MTLFGKSTGARRLEVMAAELLPYGEQLFVVIVDADCNLHILQYDPERELYCYSALL
jgi:cleavage and polyadenylation specificity factor subunit 1